MSENIDNFSNSEEEENIVDKDGVSATAQEISEDSSIPESGGSVANPFGEGSSKSSNTLNLDTRDAKQEKQTPIAPLKRKLSVIYSTSQFETEASPLRLSASNSSEESSKELPIPPKSPNKKLCVRTKDSQELRVSSNKGSRDSTLSSPSQQPVDLSLAPGKAQREKQEAISETKIKRKISSENLEVKSDSKKVCVLIRSRSVNSPSKESSEDVQIPIVPKCPTKSIYAQAKDSVEGTTSSKKVRDVSNCGLPTMPINEDEILSPKKAWIRRAEHHRSVSNSAELPQNTEDGSSSKSSENFQYSKSKTTDNEQRKHTHSENGISENQPERQTQSLAEANPNLCRLLQSPSNAFQGIPQHQLESPQSIPLGGLGSIPSVRQQPCGIPQYRPDNPVRPQFSTSSSSSMQYSRPTFMGCGLMQPHPPTVAIVIPLPMTPENSPRHRSQSSFGGPQDQSQSYVGVPQQHNSPGMGQFQPQGSPGASQLGSQSSPVRDQPLRPSEANPCLRRLLNTPRKESQHGTDQSLPRVSPQRPGSSTSINQQPSILPMKTPENAEEMKDFLVVKCLTDSTYGTKVGGGNVAGTQSLPGSSRDCSKSGICSQIQRLPLESLDPAVPREESSEKLRKEQGSNIGIIIARSDRPAKPPSDSETDEESQSKANQHKRDEI